MFLIDHRSELDLLSTELYFILSYVTTGHSLWVIADVSPRWDQSPL